MAVALLLGVNFTYNLSAAHKPQVLGYATDINASDVISLTNQQRAANGLGALSTNAQLNAAAQAKAQDMFANNYWAHDSPSGKTPWDFIAASGYHYSTAGENLAKDFDTSGGVVNAWMNSSEHRANILNSSYIDTGVAVMNGTLQGSETTLVVAMYASPASQPHPAAPAASTTPTVPKTSSAPKASSGTVKAATNTTPTPTQPTTTAAAPTTATTNPVTTPTATHTTSTATAAKSTTTPTPITTDNEQDVSFRRSRTWAANASLFILSTLLLVSILKHTLVWRTKRRGLRHIWLRAHPAAQYVLLFVAIAANLATGVGTVR